MVYLNNSDERMATPIDLRSPISNMLRDFTWSIVTDGESGGAVFRRPFDNNAGRRLHEARLRMDAGRVDCSDFDDERAG